MTRTSAIRPAMAVLICVSGSWAEDSDATRPEPAHFHHVAMNVTDVEKSMAFYSKVFGAVPVDFRGVRPALFVERSFLLFEEVDEPAPHLKTAIWHIGWGGVDVPAEHRWWRNRGVEFAVPPTRLPGRDNYYMYYLGPDGEEIEVNTMGHHRFAHVHLFATDVNEMSQWFIDHLGASARRREVPKSTLGNLLGIWMNVLTVDNVSIIVFGKPASDPPPSWWPREPLVEFESTKGSHYDHIAFSYRDIEPVFERMKASGLKIVEPIADRPESGMRSFFVEAPEKVLIEIVEAKPIPEGLWD